VAEHQCSKHKTVSSNSKYHQKIFKYFFFFKKTEFFCGCTAHDNMVNMKVPTVSLEHSTCSLHTPLLLPSISLTPCCVIAIWKGLSDLCSWFVYGPAGKNPFISSSSGFTILVIVPFFSFIMNGSAWAFDRSILSNRK
jgi:hypothetical protein